MKDMIRSICAVSLVCLMASTASAQKKDEEKKILVISRTVEGEVRTNYGDTLYGDIKVREASDKHITSIVFKENGKKKAIYSAHDIKKFRQVVPYPDRPSFGVEEVYYKSMTDPKNSQKKYFVPIDEWK